MLLSVNFISSVRSSSCRANTIAVAVRDKEEL